MAISVPSQKIKTEDVPAARKREYLLVALRILAAHQEAMSPRAVFAEMRLQIQPAGVELEPYATQPGIPRFETITRWMTIRAAKAGWIIKRDGLWEITPDGLQAVNTYTTADALGAAAVAAYKAWRKSQPLEDDVLEEADGDPAVPSATLSTLSLEDARERNREALEAKVNSLNPYEVQDMVAALLRAMGYHVSYVAKPGRDRGLDIVAYHDPLGTTTPRIKVQVKHRDQIGRGEIDKFVGAIRTEDVGIYVSTGGFSSEARAEARTHRTHDLTLVDLPELISLWTQHYSALEENAKHFLPLEVVYFLAEG